jgi:exopolysaccharide production protein ExoQ
MTLAQGTRQARLARLEFGLFVLSILIIAGAWAAFVPGGQGIGQPDTEVLMIAESGDSGKQVLFTLVYILNFVLLGCFTRFKDTRFLGLPLLLLLGWCLVSTTWSVLPDGTIRRVVAMTGTLIVGLYAGQRFNEDRLSAAFCVAATVACIGSLLWAGASPSHAIDADGNLRGLFYHKNVFGLFLAMSLLTVFFRIVVLRHRQKRYFLLLGLCGLTFVLAHSATPIVGMTAALFALLVATLARDSAGPFRIILPTVFCLAVAGVVLFSSDLSAFAAEALERDPSLSGRTAIWAFVTPMIGASPWVGYGYGIFWLGEGAPGALFWYWTKQFELHAHDGYLQLLLDTGVVGLALFLTALALLITRTVRLGGRGRWTLSAWVTLFLGFFLVCNITDTELWQSNSLMTMLFIWATVRINREDALSGMPRLYPAVRRPIGPETIR